MGSSAREVALVTGCSAGGIGHALAEELAERGFHVVATSRSTATMAGLAHRSNLELMALDVTSLDSIAKAVASTIAAHGRIDLLINNAGVPCIAPLAEIPLPLLDSTFRTNVYGPVALIQAVVPYMVRERRGKIVNVGSIGGFASGPWGGAYNASKAAMHALTDTLRVELKPFGVEVTLVVPGAVISNIGERSASITGVLKLNMYKLYEANIIARTRYSQQAESTPAAKFAKKTVDAILKKKPPCCFVYGHLSAFYTFLYYLPLWVRDWIFARKSGLC